MSIMSWLKSLTARRRLDDDDFEEEIRAHLAIAAEERTRDGVDPKSARYAALKDFGNVALTTEAARRVWTPAWLDGAGDVGKDIRYAIRGLVKNPAFALSAVLFSALAVLLAIAVADAGRTVVLLGTVVGVLASVVQFLGLIRWPFLVPYLARTAASTPPPTSKASIHTVPGPSLVR